MLFIEIFAVSIDLHPAPTAIMVFIAGGKGAAAMLLRQLKYFLAVVETDSFTEIIDPNHEMK